MPTWAISAAGRSRSAWLFFVMPALMLNYMGQGAMILSLRAAEAAGNGQESVLLPGAGIAAPAAGDARDRGDVIASQAVISGAFSVTQQAIQLGFIPRLSITHTSEAAAGQIYIPVVNWALMVDGHPARADLPQLVEPRRRLRHRGDRRDVDRHRPDRRGAARAVEVEPLRRRRRCSLLFFAVDIAYFGANLTQGARRAAGSRCWSAPSPSPC